MSLFARFLDATGFNLLPLLATQVEPGQQLWCFGVPSTARAESACLKLSKSPSGLPVGSLLSLPPSWPRFCPHHLDSAFHAFCVSKSIVCRSIPASFLLSPAVSGLPMKRQALLNSLFHRQPPSQNPINWFVRAGRIICASYRQPPTATE
jgi:hypothetical protein